MSTPSWFTRDLSIGDEGEDVLIVQRKTGAKQSKKFDEDTAARVRGVQRKAKKKETGSVDAETAAVLGEPASRGLLPEWFERDLQLGDMGEDVKRVRAKLDLDESDDRFTADVDGAVKRYQSGKKIRPTGVVDEQTAKELGD